jgi:hypothetical protein
MPQSTLEERVTTLERQVRDLLAEKKKGNRPKDWRRTSGAFTGDDLMKQVFVEGRKIRETERKQARTKQTRQS